MALSRICVEFRRLGYCCGVAFAVAVFTLAANADDRHGNNRHRDNSVPGPVSARVLRVIDGDTIAVRALIWVGQSIETRVRIAGVDAPELRGDCPSEIALATAARDLVVTALGDLPATLWDVRYDKYGGRVLARVKSDSGEDIAALLIAAGLGRLYNGGKRAPWC